MTSMATTKAILKMNMKTNELPLWKLNAGNPQASAGCIASCMKLNSRISTSSAIFLSGRS
jgi:hypothetical protein